MLSRSEAFTERRPWFLWFLSAVIMLVGAIDLWQAWDHVVRAGDYRDLGVSYPPLLRAGFALGWGVALMAFGVGLARRRRWARRWILLVISNYGVFGVLWMVVFAASDFGRERIGFQAVLTVVVLALLAWVLHLRRVTCRFEP